MGAKTDYDVWLSYLDRLTDSRRSEYESILMLYLDSVAMALADTDFMRADERSTANLLERVEDRMRQRVEYLADIPNMVEMLEFHQAVVHSIVSYQHQNLERAGRAAPTCSLSRACSHHPEG